MPSEPTAAQGRVIHDNNGHIHPLGHFCGSNCPKHKPYKRGSTTAPAGEGRSSVGSTPDPAAATTQRRSRLWWFWRMFRAYRKHGCLRFRGLRRTWDDAMFARRMMAPVEQWKLDPIRKVPRV